MSRVERAAELTAARDLDLLLVSQSHNLRYLTGFTGSNALALIGTDVRRFLTDFRYVEQAGSQVEGFDLRSAAHDDLFANLPAALDPSERPHRIGFEDAHVSVRQHERLQGLIPDTAELVPASGLIEELRAVKDEEEVERIRAATELADEVLGAIAERGLRGRTERAIATDIEHELRLRGADGPSFPPIVAGGSQGALPHAEPRDVPVEDRALVVIDLGAQLDGYCSDCTRTLATAEIDGAARDAYEAVLAAQVAGLAAIRPGPAGRDVDAAARKVLTEAGFGERFGHGLGHGVGLEVHEDPRLSRRGEEPLRAGHVVTVEPGVYLPGEYGIRIEDLVVVREEGAEILTSFPKELTVVG